MICSVKNVECNHFTRVYSLYADQVPESVSKDLILQLVARECLAGFGITDRSQDVDSRCGIDFHEEVLGGSYAA